MAILDRPADPLPLKQQSSTLSDSSVPVVAANDGTKDGPAANSKTQQQVHYPLNCFIIFTRVPDLLSGFSRSNKALQPCCMTFIAHL